MPTVHPSYGLYYRHRYRLQPTLHLGPVTTLYHGCIRVVKCSPPSKKFGDLESVKFEKIKCTLIFFKERINTAQHQTDEFKWRRKILNGKNHKIKMEQK